MLRDHWLGIFVDEPCWIDTRGVLLEGPELHGDSSGCVAVRRGGRLLVAMGSPPEAAFESALEQAHSEADLLATGEAIAVTREHLAIDGERALIHALGADGLALAEKVFGSVGITLVIDEEQMSSATALCACGTAFFLRAIRAASQGGIEIGFHSDDALAMASQTAKGAAALLLARGLHPEREIDQVTTPRGATISGLNEMEHQGFSSALIRGITTSAEKVEKLYKKGG